LHRICPQYFRAAFVIAGLTRNLFNPLSLTAFTLKDLLGGFAASLKEQNPPNSAAAQPRFSLIAPLPSVFHRAGSPDSPALWETCP